MLTRVVRLEYCRASVDRLSSRIDAIGRRIVELESASGRTGATSVGQHCARKRSAERRRNSSGQSSSYVDEPLIHIVTHLYTSSPTTQCDVLTATAVLFLPPASTACPTGWTPSNASATCFLVPPERSTSLFRRVDLCKEHGGTPTCIGSAEENAIVTAELAAADGLWLGLYQNDKGLGRAKGWGRCVAGDAPSFTNWYEGEPD